MIENRKTRWSRRRRQAGLCFCGEPLQGKSLCPYHLEMQRKRMLARHGRLISNSALHGKWIPDPASVRRPCSASDNEHIEKFLPLLPKSTKNHIVFPTDSSCWLWTGQVTRNHRYNHIAYGLYSFKEKLGDMWVTRSRAAHRFIYEALVEVVPLGLELDHLCEVKLCVNPAHLEPVTHQENVIRNFVRKQRFGGQQ